MWLRGLQATIVSMLMSSIAAPIAEAHCFTTWHYPWPQRCSVRTFMRPQPEDKTWYVEFVLPTDRDRAIDELRKELK
jgi:hypothetical protein